MVALDKATGAVAWKGTIKDGDTAGYASVVIADFGGVKLTVDRMSAPYIEGASIDFVDTIEKQGFTIDNPNAQGSCACGDSFH